MRDGHRGTHRASFHVTDICPPRFVGIAVSFAKAGDLAVRCLGRDRKGGWAPGRSRNMENEPCMSNHHPKTDGCVFMGGAVLATRGKEADCGRKPLLQPHGKSDGRQAWLQPHLYSGDDKCLSTDSILGPLQRWGFLSLFCPLDLIVLKAFMIIHTTLQELGLLKQWKHLIYEFYP